MGTLRADDSNGILSSVLLEYSPISKAPDVSGADSGVKARERAELYKSVDSYGNVYLIQNPTAWEEELRFKPYRHVAKKRPEPVLKLSAKQARQEAGMTTGKKSKAKDIWGDNDDS